ncbi:hypothetical protein [Paenibacillus tundrae]|uniref:hypothetical protein n=1 Tax=Paenibacillus tundrae TaxID=528187 RepID=UPI0030CF5DEF
MQQRKPIDPFFQSKIKYDVVGEQGQLIGEVFLLSRDMLPTKQPDRKELITK